MKESIELTATFKASPAAIYAAWLDSKAHSEMTGGTAICSDQIGGEFTAWDGYITGTNKSLKPNEEIIQSWRTSEFQPADEDSELTIRLAAVAGGTELTLIHRHIPEGQTQYKQGWINHYFTPMKAYFGN